ncbi:PP2C family protein-serine/threonine phosphatase [Thermodesulfobacteriota bacterium]
MSEPNEKRKSYRRHEEALIMFARSSGNLYCSYGAQMLNQSENGMYFETDYLLEPGELVLVRKARWSLGECSCEPETLSPMRVVWCEKQKAGLTGFRYCAGAVRVEGADILDRPESDHSFRDQEDLLGNNIQYLESLRNTDPQEAGDHFGLAVDLALSNAKMLQLLNRIAFSVGSTLDLQAILQTICRELVAIFDSRNAGIGLLDATKRKVKLVAFHSSSPNETDATGLELPVDGNASTIYVLETGQPIVVPDVQNNPITSPIHEIARRRGTESLMIVPLMSYGEVIGTIGMPAEGSGRIFTSEEVSLAQTIASQISGAIANARLFAESEKARRIAEQDLEIGRKIQTDFFPDLPPELEGWEIVSHFMPAREVTGDFYDFIMLEDDEAVGIVMADICDHGVGSALYMVLFRSLLRAYTTQHFKQVCLSSSHESDLLDAALLNVILSTNDYIVQTHDRSGMFATVFFGILTPRTGLMKYVNCGHTAPILANRDGSLKQLKGTGPALGISSEAKFRVAEASIEPGDSLLAYTDGMTDAQNQEGDNFGKDRLIKKMVQPFDSAQGLMDSIKSEVEHHIAGTDLYDDVTIIIVRRAMSN